MYLFIFFHMYTFACACVYIYICMSMFLPPPGPPTKVAQWLGPQRLKPLVVQGGGTAAEAPAAGGFGPPHIEI